MITRIGSFGVDRLSLLGRSGIFFFRSIRSLVTTPPKIGLIIKQIHFIGWQSTGLICLTAAFTGMVLALQGFHTLERVGSETLLGPLVALSLIRELGPVLTALLVTGRAGSAMTAELASMRNNEQIDALELMGLNPFRYLVVPNLVAGVIALTLLTWIFDVVGILGGYLVGVELLGCLQAPTLTKSADTWRWMTLQVASTNRSASDSSSSGSAATRDSLPDMARRESAEPRPRPWSLPPSSS